MSSGQIVKAQELLADIDGPDLRVIDCQFELADPGAGRRSYLDNHIPGAVFADLNDDLAASTTSKSGRHPLPSVDGITATFSRLGISSDTRVVVYDLGSGSVAARCWWLLRWLGHDNVRVLDGGLGHWRSLRLPLEKECVTIARSRFVPRLRPELVLTTAELESDIDNIAAMNLLDARDEARFRGDVEPIDSIAGHIPGAKNQPFVNCLDENGLWKSPDELQSLMEAILGPDKAIPWSVMCGSGVTACHLAISAMQGGYCEPRLYVGSWSEWIKNPARPIGLGNR